MQFAPTASLEDSLPHGEAKEALDFLHFPVPYQAVIWRNWGLVPTERLSRILNTSLENVCLAAELLGLPPEPTINPLWLTRGYMTLFRKNWHLLSYDQLAILLGWNEAKFLFHFKEDDVVWHKLGDCKPRRSLIEWQELSEEQLRATKDLKNRLQHHFQRAPSFNAFEFFQKFEKESEVHVANATDRIPLPHDCAMGDDLWFECQESASSDVPTFVERYQSKWKKLWENRIADTPDATRIRIIVEPRDQAKAESHWIEIKTREITVTAVDDRGVLRALQFLDREMINANRPFVRLGKHRRETVCELRMIYPYHVLFGDPLLADDNLPEGLLSRYSDLGINAIWLHVALPTIYSWSEMPGLTDEWCGKRLRHLALMTKQAAKYGIDIFLYLNEPRALPIASFDDHRALLGIEFTSQGEQIGTLCTSHPVVQAYLEDAMEDVFNRVPSLGGILTITMSENPTNCYSSPVGSGAQCVRCGPRDPGAVVAEVSEILFRGVRKASPKAKCIAWSWGWRHFLGELGQVNLEETIKRLPVDSYFMATSEDGLIAEVAGIQGQPVLDYSISQVGPSDWSKKMWSVAEAAGLKIAAKLQVNNSWELSSVAMLPVLNHVYRHLQNLSDDFPDCVLLSWSLGGFPSDCLNLVQEYYWKGDGVASGRHRLDGGLQNAYGALCLKELKEVFDHFSRGFSEFPYDQCVAYYGPQHCGPMNLLFEERLLWRASMVGFPYDDLESWRYPFSEHLFERQFARLCRWWKVGLDQLKALAQSDGFLRNASSLSLYRNARAAFYHFESTLQQIRFVRRRNQILDLASDAESSVKRQRSIVKILSCLKREIQVAKLLESVIAEDSTIGFEGSNHYYYTWHDLREKVLNCERLITYYQDALSDNAARTRP